MTQENYKFAHLTPVNGCHISESVRKWFFIGIQRYVLLKKQPVILQTTYH